MKPITTLNLPMPLTVNHYWARAKNGAVYLTKQAKAYKKDVAWAVKLAKTHKFVNGERLKVKITLHFATLAKNDVDNRIKGLFDALTHAGFWGDDSQVDVMVVIRGEVVKGGLVNVQVWELKK